MCCVVVPYRGETGVHPHEAWEKQWEEADGLQNREAHAGADPHPH